MRVGPQPEVRRLLKRSDFLAAARGRRFRTERMSVQGLHRQSPPVQDPADGLRLGFTLTRKVGHSTERNRIRRRLRAAAAEATRGFEASPVDVVVIARREAISAPFSQLTDDLARALATVTKAGPPQSGSGRRAPSGPDAKPGSESKSDPHA